MAKNLKVLHLSSEKTWRGGEQQIAYLIEELAALGVDNYVALRSGSAFEKYAIEKNLRFVPLSFSNTFDLRTAWEVKKYSSEIAADIIHIHSAKSHGIGVLSAVLGNRTPLVLSRRVDFVPKTNFITRWRYNHRAIRKIVGVSDKITSIMRTYTGDGEKCVTIHSGVDVSKFVDQAERGILRKEFAVQDGNILVGNTAALEHHKDYPTFIDTIARLIQMNLPVTAFVIGDGSLKEELTARVQACGLQDHIIFTGFRNDIPKILADLDIFLITSETEGLGTSVLDAFAAGIPVVATNAGGIPEMVEDRKTGMLCNVRDSESLAKAITTLVHNEALRCSLIQNAKTKVQQFHKAATARKTLTLYLEILHQSKD